jgi:hypothetical protein
VALGELEQRLVLKHLAHRSILGGGDLLAPGGKTPGDGARRRIELCDAWQPLPDRVGVALVGRRLEPAALLERPLQPAGAVETGFQRIRCATSSAA